MPAASKEEKSEGKDLLADLQDISDSERKTSTAESSMGDEEYIYLFHMAHTTKSSGAGDLLTLVYLV